MACEDRFSRADLTPALVREFLDYNPKTGVLTWRQRDRKWFATEGAFFSWNTKFAGERACRYSAYQSYYRVRVWKYCFCAHQVAWAHFYGEWPQHQIDHIDGQRGNNAIENLRDVPQSENAKNNAMRRDNTSGFVGVFWSHPHNKWRAGIKVKGKSIYLGIYERKEDAIAARKVAQKKYGFSERHGVAA